MDIVLAMKVFARVVETNSFTRAAETLDMPRARVTVVVQSLEAHLKTRLLQRTTRSLNLTPDGAAYYERCVRVLADIDDIEGAFLGKQRSPRGKLRVDMPGALGRVIVMPALGDFHERYPEIDLMLGLGDKPLDLVQEGIDCVVRIGTLQDSSLVARRVGVYQAVTVASPAYLDKAGTPQTLADLANHRAVNYYWPRTGRIMPLAFEADNGEVAEVKMSGSIAVNDAEAYLRGALSGLGIAPGRPLHRAALPRIGRLGRDPFTVETSDAAHFRCVSAQPAPLRHRACVHRMDRRAVPHEPVDVQHAGSRSAVPPDEHRRTGRRWRRPDGGRNTAARLSRK